MDDYWGCGLDGKSELFIFQAFIVGFFVYKDDRFSKQTSLQFMSSKGASELLWVNLPRSPNKKIKLITSSSWLITGVMCQMRYVLTWVEPSQQIGTIKQLTEREQHTLRLNRGAAQPSRGEEPKNHRLVGHWLGFHLFLKSISIHSTTKCIWFFF